MGVRAIAQPDRQMKRLSWMGRVLVLLVVLLGFAVRMVDLTDQPLDFHPTRQLRAAIIARGMYYQMLPTADPELRQLSTLFWSSMEYYEPQVFERLVATTYRLMGGEYLWVAKIYSSLFWVIGGIALFALLRRTTSTGAAVFSLGFYLLLPWGVMASRSFQPDPIMVMWILLSAYALYRWGESHARSWLWAVASGIFSGLAILFKVYAFYFVAMMALGVILTLLWNGGKPLQNLPRLLRLPQVWAVVVFAAAIPAFYYLGLGQRSSDFASFWIFSFSKLLLDSKFYIHWLGLIRGLMDVMIFFVALLGVFLFSSRVRMQMLGLWAGYFMLGATFPFQIYTHDYYSLVLVPIVAISLAPIADLFIQRMKDEPRWWKALFILVFLAISGYYTWVARSQFYSMNYRLEPVPWQQMGAALPKDGDIIALTHDYGSRIKYYGWRMVKRLWPGQGDINLSAAAGTDKIGDFSAYFQQQTQDMDYFLVTLFGDLEAQPELKAELYDHYTIHSQGDGYILFDLRTRH